MSSLDIIQLFAKPRPSSRDPYSALLSALVHIGVSGVISLGIMSNPRVVEPPLALRYEVRHVQLHMPVAKMSPANKADAQPAPKSSLQASLKDSASADHQAVLPQVSPQATAQQTVVQPDLPSSLVLPQEIPLPTVLLWSSMDDLNKWIVPPKPQEKIAANTHPTLTSPNQEENPAEIEISATPFNFAKLPVLPSTSSPFVAREPNKNGKTPQTAESSSQPPTKARVMVLSDLVMPEGTISLPRANQSAPGGAAGALGTGRSQSESQPGNNGKSGPTSRNNADFKTASPATTAHITLPKNGKFSAVVVGASLDEQYPETAGMWSGRMAYTVYLHVGAARNWIIQYSLPRSADAAAAGQAHLEAPYPTDMAVPNLTPGIINADAIMLHGFISPAGYFKELILAFPPQFPQSRFVLDALRQWKFRPAAQDGRPVTVEILLIIPETPE